MASPVQNTPPELQNNPNVPSDQDVSAFGSSPNIPLEVSYNNALIPGAEPQPENVVPSATVDTETLADTGNNEANDPDRNRNEAA